MRTLVLVILLAVLVDHATGTSISAQILPNGAYIVIVEDRIWLERFA